MRKFLKAFITVSVFVILFSTTVYAATNSLKVVDVLQKLPYLHDFIEQFVFAESGFSKEFFNLVRVLTEFIFGIMIISLGEGFAAQGVAVIYKDIARIVLYGAVTYIIIVMIAVVFFVSFIGIPISMLILVLGYIIVCIGKVPIVIFTGYTIELTLKKQWHIYIDYIIGGIILEAVGFIPYFGIIFVLAVLPAMSIGIFWVQMINRFFKIYYNIPLKNNFEQKKYEREKIRNIITKDI